MNFWAEHLALVDELREGIHLQRYGKNDPLLVFIRTLDEAFENGLHGAVASAAERFNSLEPGADGRIPEEGKPNGPSSTWTYLVSDNPFPPFTLAGTGGGLGSATAAGIGSMVLLPVLVILKLISVFKKKTISLK